jgi:acetyltransferase-like isoleucine patch superfamily enzyme
MVRFPSLLRALVYKPFFGSLKMPCLLGKPLRTIGLKRVFLGKRVRIIAGARIETYGKSSIHIGDNCSIGQNLHLTSGCDQDLSIGHDVTISGNVFISNVAHGYEVLNQSMMEQPLVGKATKIGNYCFLGYGCCILPGSSLGNQVIVGANAVVSGSFPDGVVIAGVPAKIIKRYHPETKRWEKA